MHKVIEIKDLVKNYQVGSGIVPALRGVSLTVEEGEFVAIMGSSGSGKSTLMNLIGGLDQPTSGTYLLDGIEVKSLSRDERAAIRNHKIGFVFQGFNLLPRTSALENVELPLIYDRQNRFKNHREKARLVLERVGLAQWMDHDPNQLSGGQQQRVAIARALINDPALVLADEPTGNLDTATSHEILAVFQNLNDQGITILLVTHENDIAHFTRRIVTLRDGQIISDEPVKDRLFAKQERMVEKA